MFPSFYDWLCAQSRRADDVGVIARVVQRDKLFPRYGKHLHLFLLRFEHQPADRELIKKAHGEYRVERRLMHKGDDA